MSNRSTIKYALKEPDFILFLLCVFTTAFGVLMVHSATRNDAISDGLLFSRDCLVMIAAASVGIIACAVISFLDYDAVVRLWPVAGGVCLLLLFLLFPFGEGAPGREDSRCWLRVIDIGGVAIRFQPSELAKVGFLVTFTAHIEAIKDNINSIKNVLLLLIHAIVPIGVVILTSLGTWGLPQMVQKFYSINNEESIKKGTIISTIFAIVVAKPKAIRATASSIATTHKSVSVRGPLAPYCFIPIIVAAGAVAAAIAPNTIEKAGSKPKIIRRTATRITAQRASNIAIIIGLIPTFLK